MCKKARRKSSKFMSLLLAVVLICGMLQVQVLAAETESVPVTMMKETETNNQTDVGEDENEGCIVAFAPDDGKTGYSDFFKVTVPTGSKVTEKPENPQRDGYFFKGWYAFEDGDGNPVFWNFETDTVQDNTTLWAAWEKGCIVAFDPDDGKAGYNDFFKVTVPIGSKVTDKPADPTRDGYLFKGWYAFEDGDGNPVFWNFETDTVQDNTTLWAAWEKGCIVAFDPDDGKTGYNDFFKVTVPIGSKVTDKPAGPTRDGYLFKGWYAFEDGDGNPVFWNFETDTVQDNTTLWAAWEKENDGGDINISGGNGNGENSGGGNGNGEDSGSGNGNNYVKIEDEKIPAGFLDLNDIPKTNDSASRHLLLWLLCGISVSGMITLTLLRKKKWVKS